MLPTSPTLSATLTRSRASGAKMVTFVGANDGLIMPRGVINYYRVMAAALRNADSRRDRLRGVQRFYRLFHAPGVSHCGLGILNHGSLGPWPQGGADFDAVINWVENGIPPSEVIGSGNTAIPAYSAASATTLTRPLCPYPQTAVYIGSGSIDQAQTGSAAATSRKTSRSRLAAARRRPSQAPCQCRAMTWSWSTSTRAMGRSTTQVAASTRLRAAPPPDLTDRRSDLQDRRSDLQDRRISDPDTLTL